MVLDEEYFAAAGIADNVAGEDEYVQALAQFNGIAHSKLQEWMEKHADTIDFLSSNYTDAITEVIQDTWDAFINNDFYGMKVFGREVKGIDDIGDFLDRGYTQGFKDGEKTVGFNVPGGFSLIDKQAMEYIKDYNFELIQRIPDDIRLGIKGSIFKGMAIGEDNQLIKNRIRNFITEPFPVYRRKDLALVEKGILKISDIKPIRIIQPEFRSNMIARTEMMRAYNQGNKSAMLGTGQDTVLIPHVPNECRFCAMFAGQVYKLNSTDCPYLPFHPHCRHYYQPQVDVEKLKNDLRELQGFQDTTGVSPYDAAMDTLGNIPPGQKKLIDDTTNALPDHLRLNKFVDEGLIESVPGSGVEFVDSRYFKIGRDLKGEDLQREYLKNYAKNIFPRYKKDWDFEGFTPEQFYDIFSKYALDPMNVDARYYRDWMSEHVFRDGFSLKYAKELAEKEANDFWDWSGKPGLIENAMYDRYHYDYRILENKYSDLNRMINNYQYGGYYEVINKDLRAGRLPGTWEASDFSEEILFLDKVLDDNNIQGLPHAFTLYRGVENPGVFKGYKVGDVFQDPGFTSTSFEKDIMESFGDWKLTILAPSGTKGLYLEEFTLEGSPTWEWLLPRGTHFKIIQRDDATKSLLLKITDEPVTKLKAPEIPIFKKELPGAHGENAPIKFKAEDGNIWWAKQVGSATAAREMYGQTLAKEYGLKTYDEMLNKSVPFVDDKGLKKALKNNYAEGSNILYTKDIPDSLTFREALDLSSRDVMLEEFHDDAMKIFVYDVLTGNTDRHLGNIMVKNDGLYSIDYGYVGNRMQFLNHLEPDILKYKTTKTDFDSWFSKTFDKYLQEFDKINLEDLPKARAFQDEGSLTDVVKLNRENFREKILSEIERHDWFQFKVPDGVNIKTELTDDELADFVRWWDRLPDKRLKETISVERMYGDFPEFDNATGVLSYVAPDKWTTLTKGEKVFRDYLSTNIWTKYAAHVFESGDDFAKAYEKHLLGQAINDKEVRELFKNVDKATVKVDFPKGVVDTKEMRMSLGDIGDFNYRWKEDFSKVVPEWELVGSYENNLNEMGKYLYDIYKNPFDNAEQMGKALDEYIQHYIIADSDNIKYFNDLFAGKIEKIPKGPEITTDMDVDLSILNKLPKDLQQDIKIVNDVSDIDLITGYVEKGILHVPDIAETDRVLDNYLYHFVTLKYEPGPFRSADRMAQGLRTYLQRGKVTKSVGGLPRSKEFQDHIKNLVDGKLPKRTAIESQGWYEAQKWADDVFEYRSVDDEIVRAVENYKQHAYKYVNEELRVGEGLSFESEALIKNIDAGMQDSPVDMVVWRATSPKEHFELKKVGDMFDDKAYASTSLSKNTALGFEKRDGYLVELHIPKGIGVTNPEKMLFNAGYDVPYQEAEVLLDRGLQYKVLKLDHTNKTAIIEVVGKYEEPPKFPVAKEVLYTDPESLTSPVKFATKDGEEYWAKALKPYDAAFEDAGYKIGQKMGIEGYPSVEVVKWNDYPDGPLKKEIETNWKNQFNKVKSDRYSDIVITKNIDHAEEFDDYFDFTYQGTKKEWFKEHDIEVKQNILLNFLIGECDAHSRNVVFDADGIMHVIDHGMAGRKLDERFVDDILTKHWFKYNPVPKSQWDDVWKKEFSFWSKQFDDPKLLDGLDPQAAKFIKENQGNIKKRISEWMDKEQRWAPEPGPKIETDIKLDDNFHTMLNKLPEDLQQDIKIVYDKDIEWGDDYFKNGVLHISQDDSQLALNKYLELVVVQKFNPGPFNSSFSFKNNLYRYLKGEKVTPKKNQNYIKKMMDGKLQERPLLEQQTVVDAQRWADEAFPDYKKTITKDEIGGIQLYKGTFYGDTNNILRKEKAWKGDAENIIPAIDNIMEKNKSPMELIVWRGSSPKEKFELKKVGDMFTDKAFVSSSLDIGTARRFTGEKGYLATIKVPKGTPLVQTEKALQDINYNLMSGKEAEILMDRNLQFKILEKNDKARTVTLEVIGKEVGPKVELPFKTRNITGIKPKDGIPVPIANKLSEEQITRINTAFKDIPKEIQLKIDFDVKSTYTVEKVTSKGKGGIIRIKDAKDFDTRLFKGYGELLAEQLDIYNFDHSFGDKFAAYVTKDFNKIDDTTKKALDNLFATGKWEPPKVDISKTGKKAIQDYQADKFFLLNSNLRHHPKSLTKEEKKMREELDKIMTPLKEDSVVYRNWGSEGVKEDILKAGEGGVFKDKGFISTSFDESYGVPDKISWTAEIHVPKGSKSIDFDKTLQTEQVFHEDELLLARNTRFKILKLDEKNKHVILEVTKDKAGPATLDPKVEKEALKTEPMKEVREIKTKNIELSTEETNILQKMMGDLPEKYRPSSSDVLIRSFGKEPYEGRDGSGGVFGGMQLLIAEKTIDEDKLDNIIKAYGQAIRTQHKITSNELFDESFANYVLHQELLSKKVIKVYDNFFKSGKFNDNILKGIEKVELIKPQITPLNPKPKIKKVVEKVGNYKTINSSTGSDWISGIFSKQYDKVVSKDKKFAEHLETAKSHTDSLNVHFNKGGKVKDLDNVESLMQKTLDSAINNFKMPDNTIVYRGLKTKYVDPKLKTGDIFAPNCYSYTTLNKKWAEGFAGDEGYTVRYLLPKGTNAFSFDLIYTLGGMEVPYRLEQEFLLAREQAFKVLNVNHNTKEMTVVAVNVKKT